MRFAQIVGIPFPWKNSTTIKDNCRKLTKNERVENGDIIWMPGHVMIISNIEKNELIEARGYRSGYGCVHRLTLKECFSDIKNYGDLENAYYQGTSIHLLDKRGQTIPVTIMLLKLI